MQKAGNYNLTVDTGGTREPRAWKLASAVRGGAVGKGLCYSTSLAAYSTLAAHASISVVLPINPPAVTHKFAHHTNGQSPRIQWCSQ